jgi:hypothetical protein
MLRRVLDLRGQGTGEVEGERAARSRLGSNRPITEARFIDRECSELLMPIAVLCLRLSPALQRHPRKNKAPPLPQADRGLAIL